MGGIFGALSPKKSNVIDVVISGLKRLEYRGFSGSGIAFLQDNDLVIYKDAVRIDKLIELYRLDEVSSWIAIGQTRYATHGKPHKNNTEPHTDCKNSLAIVGDGAIENYEFLKDATIIRGHKVVSKCDFEIIVHMIEDELGRYRDIVRSINSVVKDLEGFYTFALLLRDYNSIVLYTSLQPIFIGISKNIYLFSSNKSSMYGIADRYIELGANELGIISENGVDVYSLSTQSRVVKEERNLDVDPRFIDRGGFPHHMIREIYEIPFSLLRTISSVQDKYLSLSARFIIEARNVFIIGNGTSLHAGLVASYYLSELANVNPIVVSAAEFPLYYVDNIAPGSLVIAISQSGETGDVLQSVYEAKLRGATILGITNYIGSRLANLSNIYLPIGAGPEISIPATKTFTSTLMLLYMLALKASRYRGNIDESEYKDGIKYAKIMAQSLNEYMHRIDKDVAKVVKFISQCRSGYIVSRGITYPIALEGALKFKETAYVHAEGVEAGEFKHGPQSLLDENIFTIFIIPTEKIAIEPTYSLISMAKEYKTKTIVIGYEGDQKLDELGDIPVIKLPAVKRHLTPIIATIPLQFLAYRLGIELGRPIDTPRYLSKTVH
ncbi:sugar isomerase (SIS) [Ignisphaera aggregans DSM 17230]|uniref:glutamine--fructose-6-phosphate transaminase (isomerizing) n=1 Tax=Ignisphaera aggregans (strain DSM 17230 / JCM 13409 / AQ1.S1) TaxID=583356 RepID=E0SSN5_IGNAA|nr:sugar isomerase (SIS) [Ignisphaera aggregans DSM 17230]